MSQRGIPYATWASSNGVAGSADEDSDNDGVDNGVEYFMGITSCDPAFTANPGLDSSNAISWPASATFNGNYEVETSPDLSTWTPVRPKPVPSGGFLNHTLPPGAQAAKASSAWLWCRIERQTQLDIMTGSDRKSGELTLNIKNLAKALDEP